MHCIVTYATGVCSKLSKISSQIQIFNFGSLSSCIYVSKDVSIRGYFSKPKGVSEQNSLGHTGVDYSVTGRECLLFGLRVLLSNYVMDGNDFCARGLE